MKLRDSQTSHDTVSQGPQTKNIKTTIKMKNKQGKKGTFSQSNRPFEEIRPSGENRSNR